MDPQTMALSEFTAENVEKVILGSSVRFEIASKHVQEKVILGSSVRLGIASKHVQEKVILGSSVRLGIANKHVQEKVILQGSKYFFGPTRPVGQVV